MSKINLKDIEVAFDKLIESIRSKHEDSMIELNEDYYWCISSDEIYNVYENPKELTVGSLHDDLDEIKKMSSEDYYAVPVLMNKLVSLLSYLGTK